MKETVIYAIPLKDDRSQMISDHFGEAPCFALVTVRIKDHKIIMKEILANPFTHVVQGKGILVAEFLIRHPIDAVITREHFAGKGPFYVFSNAAVGTHKTQEDTVEGAPAQIGMHAS